MAMLGSYIPGATMSFWIDPRPWVATTEPALLRDPARLRREASHLALREALRRPGFHAARIAASILKFSVTSEADNLYWSLGDPGVLPEPLQARGQAFMKRVGRPLCLQMLGIQTLFLASLALALWQRDATGLAILALAAAVLLKVGLHGAVVAQSRYVLAATALEILAIALGIASFFAKQTASPLLVAGGVGLAGSLAMLFLLDPALGWVYARDKPAGQLIYRFPVHVLKSKAELDCEVAKGTVLLLDPRPTLRLADRDPAPGTLAAADCVLTKPGDARREPLAFRVHDPYAPGGLPDRVVQRVTLDGAEVLAWDVGAEPWTGWKEIPLSPQTRKIRVEILAVRPDPGAAWGDAVVTEFELVMRR